jgi:MaoC like domain
MRLESPPGLVGSYRRAITPRRRGGDMPDLELELPGVEVERDHLAAYARVCGFRLRDELPPTYPHVLAFPLAMRLMTDRRFPVSLLGLVHIRNRIRQLRPLLLGEPLTLRVRAGRTGEHERGTQFDVVAEAEARGVTVWEGVSTYLRISRPGGSRDGERSEPPTPAAIWTVADDTGRRYAAVSGDRNPIHLRRLTAKAFGQPRPIAHGMWLKARCLAALEGALPDPLTADARFRSPVRLPSRVAFASWPDEGGRGFALWSPRDGRPYVAGSVGVPHGSGERPAG